MATAVEAAPPVADVGLTILSNPKDAVLDIIFVHGLQGHPQDTWTYKSKPAQSPQSRCLSPSKAAKSTKSRTLRIFPNFSKRKHLELGTSGLGVDQENNTRDRRSQEQDVFWPGDLLKDDVPMARIMTFGYNMKITQGYQAAHQGNIFSHARDLLYELEEKRRKVADRNLVFIAHSLGGILVKEVLRRSQTDPDKKIQKIFASTTGVFFFSTPHRGSKDWASFGEGVVGVAGRLLGMDTNNQVIHALLPSGPELELCRESFTTQWIARGDSLVVRTFQESKGVTGIRLGGFNQLVVPPDSSSLDHPNQRARTIDENHIEMVKFKGRNDKAYEMVKADIEELVEKTQSLKETSNRRNNMTKEDQECIQHLRITDPRDDKTRIEGTKGGLLEDSYHWILENSDFQQWRDNQQSRLLWIKGDPGKGKTMLLCGIINELKKLTAKTCTLSYFFCQATDSRINTATAVLRGLLYLLVDQQPSLISHIRKKHDDAGKRLFEDTNAWVALSKIFASILQDPNLNNTYLIVDAVDECVADLPKLLDFIVKKSPISSRVKWIVSSRNWPDIEERLDMAGHKVRLCLELNAESISTAVGKFIQYKVLQLAQQKKYNNRTQNAVLRHLSTNANGTFLWVALVCQNLEETPQSNTIAKLNAFPPGLNSLYERMMEQISSSDNCDLYKQILASIAVVYRPITLQELTSLVEMPDDMANDLASIKEIISLCGSFLTIRDGTIYFVHQSAKDFLSTTTSGNIFPSGRKDVHYAIFSRSFQIMSRTLQRDMYSLGALGYPNERVIQPDPDPLVALRYSSVYWVDHLHDWKPDYNGIDSQDKDAIESFIRKKYLYWLEALSLCRSMSEGVLAISKLNLLAQRRADAPSFVQLLQDARLFTLYHIQAIRNSPIQVYVSALLFSPKRSRIRSYFREEEPKWIQIKPAIEEWSACLQTLEGHSHWVKSVAFSHDSTRLASASWDYTVKIWDASSGECLQTLKGHSGPVQLVAFSHDSTRLASASRDDPVKIWDVSSGECLQTLEGHNDWVCLVAFSHDSTRLASASDDHTVKIWDASSGKCLQTLSIGKRLSSISFDIIDSYLHTDIGTIDVRTLGSRILSTISEPHSLQDRGLALSSDGVWITHGSENLVWLPSEYRPSCSAVSGKTIGVGVGTGRVWICKVELDTS